MAKKATAAELLAALQGPGAEDDDTPPVRMAPQLKGVPAAPAAEADAQEESREESRGANSRAAHAAPKPVKAPKRGKSKPPRSELKHIGGYLDDETVEKVALLRIRLKLENSDLLKLAIDDLYRKHTAKRAFGDA
ncbi:hypothetical protein [Acidisphaera sp. L21]|uniref:hypothetical protein n=1 Tax=Acidisphaera sp. L21 TaxID=1641851 RepID=UPI00131B9E82|nr:hypothetical protein [Acidisphaera sp. L21]